MCAKTANEREWLENQIIEQIRGMTPSERERICDYLRELFSGGFSAGEDAGNITRKGAELVGGEPSDHGGIDFH